MLKVGTVVRVIYPEYAAGIQGVLQAQETSGRWIVQLEKHSEQEDDEPLLLSLEESDFEVINVDD